MKYDDNKVMQSKNAGAILLKSGLFIGLMVDELFGVERGQVSGVARAKAKVGTYSLRCYMYCCVNLVEDRLFWPELGVSTLLALQ